MGSTEWSPLSSAMMPRFCLYCCVSFSPHCGPSPLTVVAMTTDEAERQQRRNVRPSPGQDRGPGGPPDQQDRSSPEDQAPRPRTRGSGRRRLPRLFSSLRKQRSQCSEEERNGTGEQWATKELKAPIADPEPELRAEEDAALDLQSLSSAEIQVTDMFVGVLGKERGIAAVLCHVCVYMCACAF